MREESQTQESHLRDFPPEESYLTATIEKRNDPSLITTEKEMPHQLRRERALITSGEGAVETLLQVFPNLQVSPSSWDDSHRLATSSYFHLPVKCGQCAAIKKTDTATDQTTISPPPFPSSTTRDVHHPARK